MLNLAALLEDSARNVPDREAVAGGTTRLTYAELDAKASQVAGALTARGINPVLTCPQGRFDIATIATRMRIAVSGGAALPAEVMRRLEERFGVPILEGYGLSETSPIATFNRVDRPRRPGSIGLPARAGSAPVTSASGTPAATCT